MNKKAQTISIGFILAIFAAIIILLFLVGGGAGTIYNISKTLSNIPIWVWIIVIFIFIFKVLGGKK